jgi:hypothetical protein
MRLTTTTDTRAVRVAAGVFSVLLTSGLVGTAVASAQCPNMPPPRVEQVNFVNNEKVVIDHMKEGDPKKLTKGEEAPEKALKINEFEGEAGEGLDEVEWKSPKAGKVSKNWPLAFPEKTSMEIEKTRFALEVETQQFLKTKLEGEVEVIGETTVGAAKVKITFKQKITEAEAKAQMEGVGSHPSYLEMPAKVTASVALPEEVSYSEMTINWKWKVKEKGGPTIEQAAGSTVHNLYLTYVKSLSPEIYLSLLAQETENITKDAAKPTKVQVISGVWKEFTNGAGAPSEAKIWTYNPGVGGKPTQGTKAMWYYEEMPVNKDFKEVTKAEGEAFASLNGLGKTSQLLEYLDGECGAWREALKLALEAEGIANKNVEITAKVEVGGPCAAANECDMLVRKWKLPKAGGGFPNAEAEVEKEEGVAGQGVKTPSSTFVRHFMLEVENKLYDPSYGIGPVAGAKVLEGPLGGGAEANEILQKYQETSIGGLCKTVGAEDKCQETNKALEIEVKEK